MQSRKGFADTRLHFDEWLQWLANLRTQRNRNPLMEGWALLEGDDWFGEAATQGWDQLSLDPIQISQRMRAGDAFPPAWIEANDPGGVFKYSCARTLSSSKITVEDRYVYAKKCIKEGWTDQTLKDRLREEGLLPPVKPRVRRYTVDEMRELYRGWTFVTEPNVMSFLDWLAVREDA